MESIANWSSIVGLGIGVVSLAIVFYQVPRARRAAEEARSATAQLTTALDLDSLMPLLDELWAALAAEDRQQALWRVNVFRKSLARVMARSGTSVTDDDRNQLRGYLVALGTIERQLRTGDTISESEALSELLPFLAELSESIKTSVEVRS